jgi:hypothetical protein
MNNDLARRAHHMLRESDSWQAIEFLNGQDSLADALAAYDELVRHLYWQEKDVAASLAMGRAGVQAGLQSSDQALRSTAKTIAYNLAAFTWPGWDEPGITLHPPDLHLGREAAQLNLRLAGELEKGDLPTARAHWMLGAHLLAAGEKEAAAGQFDESMRLAKAAGQRGEELLAEGFAALARGNAVTLVRVRDALGTVEHGEVFAGQIETAERVFALG